MLVRGFRCSCAVGPGKCAAPVGRSSCFLRAGSASDEALNAARSSDRSDAHRHQNARPRSRGRSSRRACALCPRAGGRRRPARGGRRRPRSGSDVPSDGAKPGNGGFCVGDARCVTCRERLVRETCTLGRGIFRHEQRYLMTTVKIIEIQTTLHRRKREHGPSLSRVGLQTRNPRDTQAYHMARIPPNRCPIWLQHLHFVPNRPMKARLLVANDGFWRFAAPFSFSRTPSMKGVGISAPQFEGTGHADRHREIL